MLNTIAEIFATVLDVVFMVWFIPKFNRTNFWEKKWTIVFPVFQLIFQLIADYFITGFDTVCTFVFILISSVYAFTICNGKYFRALLSTSLHNTTLMIVSSSMYFVFSYLINDFNSVLQGTYSDARIIYLLLAKIIIFAIYKLLLFIFRADDTLDLKNSLICFVFTLMSTAGLFALIDIITKTQTKPTLLPIVILVWVIILSNIIFYFMIYTVRNMMKLKFELKLAKERMEFEAEKMEEAHKIWDNIRKVRHDIKNHLTVISGHLEYGMIDECKKYVKKIEPSIDSMGDLIRSNNVVMDYIINSKLSNPEGIKVYIMGCMDGFEDIEDTDIACIMGNIIDNALEAQNNVSGEKRIELIFTVEESERSIICKNTIESSVLKKNTKFKTTKKDKDSHGIGHKIVETSVKKYGGIVDYFEEEKIFGVQIILPKSDKTTTTL